MPGYPCCCDPPEMINDCTEFLTFWASVIEAELTVTASNNNCPDCAANLSGTFILDESVATTTAPCRSLNDGNSFRTTSLGYDCVISMINQAGPGRYYLSAVCGEPALDLNFNFDYVGGCLTHATRSFTFPISVSDLMSGTLTASGTTTTTACHITGDVPYELFV